MYAKYGSHQHANGEIILSSFSKTAKKDKRGQHSTTLVQVQLEGVLVATSQSTLTTAILALESAYGTNGKDWGLYQDDGTKSAHWIDSSKSLSGTFVSLIVYPEGGGAEYALYRKYNITVEAEFLEGSGLISFQETLSFNGNGGPRFVILETAGGVPVKQIVNQRTKVRATQSGSAFHMLAYPTAPSVLWPFAYRSDLSSSRRVGPTLDGNRYTNFGTQWNYQFEHTGSLVGSPNFR